MGAAAPGDLELIRGFVNTLDVEEGRDELPAWLGTDDPQTVAVAARTREALRNLLRAHHGADTPAAESLEVLNAAASDAALVVQFDRDATPRLVPAHPDDRWARLLAAIYRAGVQGTWRRLKVCPADDCQWAFYDASKNRSRTWCSMQVCGNRAKARSYRSRQRG
jgi:predicted RNA-binding Zn ribbon-like protein